MKDFGWFVARRWVLWLTIAILNGMASIWRMSHGDSYAWQMGIAVVFLATGLTAAQWLRWKAPSDT